MRHSQQDAAAARVLAGGADRDVTEMRRDIRDFREQNTRVLNAMREDLRDLRGDLNATREDLSDLRSHVENGFAEIRGRLDAAAAGQEQIARMLNILIAREGGPDSGQ